MAVRKIVSGGQTGADRGGLDAAIGLGIEHGGWCPRGRRAEDGTIPNAYRLSETSCVSYTERTDLNVRDSDATVVFTLGPMTPGSRRTMQPAIAMNKPSLHLALDVDAEPTARLRQWCVEHGVVTLNVAGSRESKARGLQQRTREVVSRHRCTIANTGACASTWRPPEFSVSSSNHERNSSSTSSFGGCAWLNVSHRPRNPFERFGTLATPWFAKRTCTCST